MKKFLILFLIVLIPNKEAFTQSIDISSIELEWEYYELSNGLNVLLQQDLNRSDVSIEFWLLMGTADEKLGQYGLAHFFEHATPYGLQDDEEKSDKLGENMNFSNAQTRPDFTRYHIQVNPEVFELGLRYVSDRLKADTSAITEEWVERHRTNVLQEFDRQTKHPFWGGSQRTAMYAGTFGEKHPYGHSSYGSRENNENFKIQDFREWFDQHVFAKNTTLFIIGNFEVEETKALIDNYFSDIHQKEKSKKPEPISPKQKAGKEVVKAPTENHTLVMSWAVPGFGSKDDPALYLIANILNERLAKNESWPGSVSDAGASTSLYKMAGEFFIYATFSTLSDSSVAEQYLQQNLQEILSEGVTEDELERAVQTEVEYIRGTIENERMGMWSSRTALLGESLLFTGNPDFYLTRLKRQSEFKTETIQQAPKKWLSREPFQLFVISNTSNTSNPDD